MKRITIDGVPGVALWDDSGPLIAFRPDGEDEWLYIPRPKPAQSQPGSHARAEWREGYDELGWRE